MHISHQLNAYLWSLISRFLFAPALPADRRWASCTTCRRTWSRRSEGRIDGCYLRLVFLDEKKSAHRQDKYENRSRGLICRRGLCQMYELFNFERLPLTFCPESIWIVHSLPAQEWTALVRAVSSPSLPCLRCTCGRHGTQLVDLQQVRFISNGVLIADAILRTKQLLYASPVIKKTVNIFLITWPDIRRSG